MISINGNKINQSTYPDGTPSFKYNIPFPVNDCHDANIIWQFDNMGELFTLVSLVRHLQEHGYNNHNIALYMPYIPNARMDRVHDTEDIFMLKYFTEIINSLDLRYVKVLDPHSYVSEGLIDRIRVQTPTEFISRIMSIENIDTYFFPDEGAMKRYSSYLNERPSVFGMKMRDWKTGNINSLEVVGDTELIKCKDILIIDDICSAGSTFYFSAKKLKELGAGNIYLYVSHCENTLLDHMDRLDGLIEKVYTTNSIYRGDNERIKVIES